jgi:hypothetical protein
MRTWNFLIVRVSVRRAVKIKAHENNRLPNAVVALDLNRGQASQVFATVFREFNAIDMSV